MGRSHEDVLVSEAVFDEIETPIGGVPPDQVMAVWDRIEPLLRRVVKPQTGQTMDSVLYALQMTQTQLWVIGDFQAIVITSIEQRPLHRVLWVQFCAGDYMDEWLDDWIAVQEEFARANDCAAVEFSGRKGWNKIHQKHRDYKPVLTTFRKEL